MDKKQFAVVQLFPAEHLQHFTAVKQLSTVRPRDVLRRQRWEGAKGWKLNNLPKAIREFSKSHASKAWHPRCQAHKHLQ